MVDFHCFADENVSSICPDLIVRDSQCRWIQKWARSRVKKIQVKMIFLRKQIGSNQMMSISSYDGAEWLPAQVGITAF